MSDDEDDEGEVVSRSVEARLGDRLRGDRGDRRRDEPGPEAAHVGGDQHRGDEDAVSGAFGDGWAELPPKDEPESADGGAVS